MPLIWKTLTNVLNYYVLPLAIFWRLIPLRLSTSESCVRVLRSNFSNSVIYHILYVSYQKDNICVSSQIQISNAIFKYKVNFQFSFHQLSL